MNRNLGIRLSAALILAVFVSLAAGACDGSDNDAGAHDGQTGARDVAADVAASDTDPPGDVPPLADGVAGDAAHGDIGDGSISAPDVNRDGAQTTDDADGDGPAPDTAGDTADHDAPDATPGPAPVLCRPCRDHGDCLTDTEGLAFCVEHGADGRHCATACGDDAPCPEGYACIDLQEEWATSPVCRPTDGTCECTPGLAVFETTCWVENENGRCHGTRTCDSECDAPTPRSESCNGVDDDCDGRIDGFNIDCSTTCGPGENVCVGGEWLGCSAPQPIECFDWASCQMGETCAEECEEAPLEVCNGVDDDCDGTTDEMTRPCSDDCGDGVETCIGGQWVDCTAQGFIDCPNYDTCETTPTCPGDCPAAPREACNGVDDNCDGVTDDFEEACESECAMGTRRCIMGLWTSCDAPSWRECFYYETCETRRMCVATCPAPPEEECNDIDDDCDGVTDGNTQLCETACGFGEETCAGGVWGPCTAPPDTTCTDWATCETYPQCGGTCPEPPDETCNGVDDDCDGTTDDFVGPCSTMCGSGEARCVDGEWVDCSAPAPLDCMIWINCTRGELCAAECPAAPPELCNNRDDDCDGTTDDHTIDCGNSCGEGTNTCIDGEWLGCTAPPSLTCLDHSTCTLYDICNVSGETQCPEAPAEECNDIDDDCDGVTDEFTRACTSSCDQGVETCVGGAWSECTAAAPNVCYDFADCSTHESCEPCPAPPAESCNGVDDDCDGETDEGEPAALCGVAPPSTCDEAGGRNGWHLPGACVDGSCTFERDASLCPWGCVEGDCAPCTPECMPQQCGDDGCGGSAGCVPAAALDEDHFRRLQIMVRWQLAASGDYISSTREADDYEGTLEGQSYYLPAEEEEGETHLLYRVRQESGEVRETTVLDEYGDVTLRTIGHVFDSALTGTCELRRWWNETTGEYVTARCGESWAAAGYVNDAHLGYAYPRAGLECEELVTLTAGELSISANAQGGGAIARLSRGDKQYLNRRDFGRLLQTTWHNSAAALFDLLLEAGDRMGCPESAAEGWSHGSPTLELTAEGNLLETSCHPLQWSPENLGGDSWHPVMWNGILGKTVELHAGGDEHVIRWTARVETPGGAQQLEWSLVRAWLTADFSTLWTYDAYNDRLADVTDTVAPGACLDPDDDERLRVPAGGVLLATADGAHALGVYRRSPHNRFALCRPQGGGDTGETAEDAAGFAALQRQPNGIAPGQHEETVYLVVGTLEEAKDAMQRLYAAAETPTAE